MENLSSSALNYCSISILTTMYYSICQAKLIDLNNKIIIITDLIILLLDQIILNAML